MEHFSYKSGCGIACIEAFTRRDGLGYNILFKTVSYMTKNLKNKAVKI